MPALLLLVTGMLCGCADRLYYYPDQQLYYTPAHYQDLYFQSADGTRLHAWLLPSGTGKTLGTVVHFHGNAQNLSAHIAFSDWLTLFGFEVFAFDYRGYGQSAGSPSRAGIHDDGLAALNYIAARTDPKRLLVFAQSLGGAIAIDVLADPAAPKVRALVLESVFASYRGIARDKFELVPLLSRLRKPLAAALVSEDKSPAELIGKLAPMPVLIVHGTADPVIPFAHAQQLYAAAGEPKQLWIVDGGGHTQAFTRFAPVFRQRLVDFFKMALTGKSAPR